MIDYIPLDNTIPSLSLMSISHSDIDISDKLNKFHTISSGTSTHFILANIDRSNPSGSVIRAYNEEYNSLTKSHPWVIEFLTKASMMDNVGSLLPYYNEINKLIFNKEFSSLNTLIKHLHANQLSDVLLVGILRLTLNIKNNLSSWGGLLNSAKVELEIRGYKTEEVLRGL